MAMPNQTSLHQGTLGCCPSGCITVDSLASYIPHRLIFVSNINQIKLALYQNHMFLPSPSLKDKVTGLFRFSVIPFLQQATEMGYPTLHLPQISTFLSTLCRSQRQLQYHELTLENHIFENGIIFPESFLICYVCFTLN
jgi:hypothetical protein